MKAMSATEILLIVGMTAVGTTMFVQLPREVSDFKQLLDLSSMDAVAKDISGLLTITVASPSDITIFYYLPENYKISLKDNYVTVENVSSKTLVNTITTIADAKALEVKKSLEDTQNKYEVRKHE